MAVKGFNLDMTGYGGFQYEIGKEYEMSHSNIRVCENGFHACENPLDCFHTYLPSMSIFCDVEQSGVLDKDLFNTKVASSKIKIGKELTVCDMIHQTGDFYKDYHKHKSKIVFPKKAVRKGDNYSILITHDSVVKSGNNTIISSGHNNIIECGDRAYISGETGQVITTGTKSAVITGRETVVNCGASSVIAVGSNSTIKGENRSMFMGGCRCIITCGSYCLIYLDSYSSISCGDMSKVVAGHHCSIRGGIQSRLVGGAYCDIRGEHGSVVSGGIHSTLRIGNVIAYVDGEKIKPDTLYETVFDTFVEV